MEINLNRSEIGLLINKLEYSFKKREVKNSKSENLNKQLSVRENLKTFLGTDEKEFIIESELLDLFLKKLEYKFRNSNNETLKNIKEKCAIKN